MPQQYRDPWRAACRPTVACPFLSCFAAIVIALLPLVPESPHYLAALGKRVSAPRGTGKGCAAVCKPLCMFMCSPIAPLPKPCLCANDHHRPMPPAVPQDEAVRVLEAAAALNGRSAQLRRHWEDVQQRQQQAQDEEPLLQQQQRRQQQQAHVGQHATPALHHPTVRVQAGSRAYAAAHEGNDAAAAPEVLELPKSGKATAGPDLQSGPGAGSRDADAPGHDTEAGAAGAGTGARAEGSSRPGSSLRSCCGRQDGPCGKLGAVLGSLLSPQLRWRTCRLAVTWFASALSYYGVVMLVPLVAAGAALSGSGGGGGSDGEGRSGLAGECLPWDAAAAAAADGDSGSSSRGLHLVLPTSAYWSMMIAAAAELPSLVLAFLTVDRWSRRRLVSYGLAATAAALAPLAAAAIAWRDGRGGGGAAYNSPPPPPAPSIPLEWQPRRAAAGFVLAGGAGGPDGGPGSGSVTGALAFSRRRLPATTTTTAPVRGGAAVAAWLPVASVTSARLFVSGAFTLLYVLTPGQYPASVRGSALGAANTLARVGAIAAPYVAVALPAHGQLAAALAVMAGACLAGAFAVAGLADEV